MAYKPAIMKRTTMATSAKGAVGWASSYVDETRKRKKKDGVEGLEIGKTYFTSRPAGTLSVHGYGKKRVDLIVRTKELDGNDAVIEYLKEHCRQQTRMRRKIMGIRLVMSMDPVKVTELVREKVDIDALLVRVAEETFDTIAKRYYPNSELCFVIGIHHDSRIHTNKYWVHKLEAEGKPVSMEKHAHIHAHLMVLPQTSTGLRISLSNFNYPGRDGIEVNMLNEAGAIYEQSIQRHIYDLSIQKTPEVGPEWDALIREAAVSTLDDFFKAPVFTDIKASRKFSLDRFTYHIRSMDREELQRRYAKRRSQYQQMARVPADVASKTIARGYAELEGIFRQNLGRRLKLADSVVASLQPAESPPFRIWDLPSRKALILNPKGVPISVLPDHSAAIDELFVELKHTRRGSLLQSVAELTTLETQLLAGRPGLKDPEWITQLARIAQLPELPHQSALDAAVKEQPQPITPVKLDEAVIEPPKPAPLIGLR
jgi:hypothetical protein